MPYASDVMRTERQKLGVKIGAFVKRLPISDGHYRNLEGGTKPAAIELFYLIAKELGIEPDDVGLLINEPPDQPRITVDQASGPTAATADPVRGAA